MNIRIANPWNVFLLGYFRGKAQCILYNIVATSALVATIILFILLYFSDQLLMIGNRSTLSYVFLAEKIMVISVFQSLVVKSEIIKIKV